MANLASEIFPVTNKRESKTGGGLCAFVRQEYKAQRLKELSYIAEPGLHQLWLKIQVRTFKSFLICTAYRPPNTPLDCFDSDFSNTLVAALSYNKPIYILGDLNCNVLRSQDPAAQALVNFCTSFNLSQVVNQPTRITETSESLIDVILASNKNLVKETEVVPSSISDHDLIYAVLNLKRCPQTPTYITTRSYKNYQRDAFIHDLSQVPWHIIETFDDVEDSLHAFNILFNQILDQHAPVRTVKVRGRPNLCITSEIRELMRTRDQWRKLARRSNDPLVWAGYRNYKQEVKREIRLAEHQFVTEQIANNANNPGSMWKTIRSCLPKKSASPKTYTQDDETVANMFNDFFTSVGQSTVDKIKALASEYNYDLTKLNFVPRHYPLSEQFSFHPVECKQVEQIVTSMPSNKAPGLDKVSVRVIKDCLPTILPSITHIINSSLGNGTFPSVWKKAVVTPIPKEGDHEQANNNRPISLLPILSKVCERAALNQIMTYLVENDRLSTKQNGNKKWHSTETALIHSTDAILTSIDKKELSAMVLLDMSKAFDSINHNILLLKLQDVGISNSSLAWFQSYLDHRYQVVRVHSTLSNALPLTSGVPQGSILGPLLFSVYINDLPSVPRKCTTECYVDDTKLQISFKLQDCPNAVIDLNDDLLLIRNWCFDNLLLLNADKTKLMVFGSRQLTSKLPDFRITLLGKELVPVSSAKDLGVILDPNITFDDHILKTASSCMSSLAQISRVKHVFKRDTLVTIINVLVFSKLFCCSSVWSNSLGKNICKLQLVQNFAARIITGTRKFDHITPALKDLRWLPIKQHLYLRDAVLAFKCMTGCAPRYLSDQFTTRNKITKRATRNCQLLNIPLFKSASGERTFHYRTVNIWNNLTSNLKTLKTISSFKFHLKSKLMEEFLT